MKKGIYSILITLLFLISCKKDKESTVDLATEKKEMLQYVYQKEVLNTLEIIENRNMGLVRAADSFQVNPNQENLDHLKEEWKGVQWYYQQAEVFNFGSVKSTFLYSPINHWPADTTLIKNHLTTTETIDVNFVNWKGSSSKGLSALEFLIFTTNPETVSQNQLDYISATAKLLEKDMATLKDGWESYGAVFMQDQLTGVNGSVNQLINAIIFELEYISNTKIGNPLGKTNGVVNENVVESPLAEISLLHAYKNLQSIQSINGTKEEGLYRYLIANNSEDVVDKLQAKFEILNAKISVIGNNLKVNISENPEEVEQIYSLVKEVLVIYKVDVASRLSVTLTFSDNDGD